MPLGGSLDELVEDWHSQLLAAIEEIAPRCPLCPRPKWAPWFTEELRLMKWSIRRPEMEEHQFRSTSKNNLRMKMLDIVGLEEKCKNNLSELLHNIDNRDFVWMDEILEEANKIFKSNFDEEPELMPKTPSQKNRRKKKRFSTTKNDPFSEKRLLERDTNRSSPVQLTSKRLQPKKNLENAAHCRMTRSQSARISNASCKTASIDLVRGRIPLVEINNHERLSAELKIEKTAAQKTEKSASANESSLDGEYCVETLQPLSKASLLLVSDTPETQIIKVGRSACKLKIANVAIINTTETEKPSSPTEELLERQQERGQDSEIKLPQNLNESAQTPRAPKANCQSVRRSLMGRTSMNKASLVQRCSLASKRERTIQKASHRRTTSRTSTAREQSSSCTRVSCRVSLEKLLAEDIIESRLQLDPASHSRQEVADQPLSHSHTVPKAAAIEEQQEGKSTENSCEKNAEVQEQPQRVRQKASYKRAVNELYDGQHTEDELSPPMKKSSSPQCPASKVVRPFKTFLHAVHKNRVLMMTPGSASQNSAIKSFLKYNSPVRTNPKMGFVQKERQRLENLKKKEEAEQQRRQKVEEEKRRRLEEMKRKREERLRKVLQARERVEQREEEKKKLIEQKLAQHNEKVQEEKMAEEKVKKTAAGKKAEELEARKQRALQLEEKRRQQELMQKKKEEEQEKARHAAELEKKLAAERELEKKKQQGKLQSQQERERKEKAAHLQRELVAAKEKERLQKEAEEKERKLQEEQQKEKSTSDAAVANKQLNVTIEIQNSPSCSSYPMTPQGPKHPKFDVNNYGMDLNSDDSTDDESQPRKPIPAWATGDQLTQAIIRQYFKPPDTDAFFGVIKSPNLEEIFYKSKPRYQKRTSSAVWNSPPFQSGKSTAGQSWQSLKRW
ncbi:PREDICTED: inner centromere protein-like [Gekko japonicus]|uniref:Inner centromere protein-like n=1 Tax=Gekko japonicus TaxID=146911 RepID=A0ABM1JTR7_GEKJA|nr:PREDICTED: inner centromere protein-like [Gekko japonicus]